MSPYEMNDISGLRYYSEAVVVRDSNGSSTVIVSPLETLNAQPSGHIIDNEIVYTGNHPTDSSESFSKIATAANTITAEWIPLNAGNRVTPPNIQKNERVMLLKYANVDKFYWIDKGFNTLRRLERVEYRFSGLKEWNKTDKEEPEHANSSDNCYIVTVDTFAGRIELSTSRANDEIVSYGVLIDGKNGELVISDSRKNKITLFSDNGKLEISTEIEVAVKSKKRILLEAPAVVADGTFYVKGDINVGGSVKYNGKLVNSAKKAPDETKVSLSKEEAAAANVTLLGPNASNPFALSLLAGTTAYAPAVAAANAASTTTSSQTTAAPSPAPAPSSPAVSSNLADVFKGMNYQS